MTSPIASHIPGTSSPGGSARVWGALLCWLTVVFEGYDLVALGAAIPALLDAGHLGMSASDLRTVATVSLVGVGIGAAVVGPLSDRYGRRKPLVVCVLLFSIMTLLVPVAPTVWAFAFLRFAAGLGLGGCMPVAITAMQEAAKAGGRSNASTLTMTGYHAGAVLASLIALLVREDWEWLFYGGGALGLLLVPLLALKMPETAQVTAVDAVVPAEHVARSAVLRPPYLWTTLMLFVAAFCGLLLVYGLNTWLPQLMRGAGYPISTSLVMLLVLNLGAIAGLLIGGRVADRRGAQRVTVLWFAAAGLMLAILSLKIGSQVVLDGVIFITGFFVFTAQVLVYGLVGYLYPRRTVGTAMGLVSAVGRLGAIAGPWVTGTLVVAGIAYPWGFYFFAAAAVLGALAVLAAPRPAGDAVDAELAAIAKGREAA
ncbi:MFS transporter [Tsukamurella spumae]|uniref:Aromatic acid/H+ symport family MFS transporter n=1 Tax=Tsukamurella spumae TaxID=44753 RepID=A0A846WXS3_9ACTN|nr:aromatic acid/H+ symport family MFS transporter [Tsukamurella spumae]NKY17166.1 aromatic acid/H+ symport family MFS transporter [Tsukamurella spumae]